MTELTQLIACSFGIIAIFGLMIRSNHIDDAKRLKRIFVKKLKFGTEGIPPTTEQVMR